MCGECVRAREELIPDATHEQFMDILWNHTCFPFGDAAQVRRHLEEYVRDLELLDAHGYSGVE